MIAKVKFVAISIMFLFYVYMYAWPADHIHVSLNVSRSPYNIKWYDYSLELQKQILIILGYKKPITLSIPCFMPELTLRFFCSFVSNALSFCTALRAMVQDEPE
ncbi:hypothetical protein QLX08_004135 [Tetragonisca angustula]|uniref:Uncharacterized protein n=1 Tax=Tetragonisca angustula TaxID=166442 RepID=A0AAW1A390_9HYME